MKAIPYEPPKIKRPGKKKRTIRLDCSYCKGKFRDFKGKGKECKKCFAFDYPEYCCNCYGRGYLKDDGPLMKCDKCNATGKK